MLALYSIQQGATGTVKRAPASLGSRGLVLEAPTLSGNGQSWHLLPNPCLTFGLHLFRLQVLGPVHLGLVY